MSIFQPQNPGIGGLDEFTNAEEAFLQNLVGLSYSAIDILYHDGNDLTNLAKGTADQHLKMNSGADGLEWGAVVSGGVNTLAAIGSSPNANAATISGTTLNLEPASASFGGVVNTTSQTFPGNKTFNGIIIGGGQANVAMLQSSANDQVSGNLSFLRSSAAGTSSATLQIGGASNTFYRINMRGSATPVLSANNSYGSLIVGTQVVTEGTSGTHPLISQIAIKPLTINDGTADTTNAATLYIEGASTGTASPSNNYALWVDDGISQFDGNVNIDGNITAVGNITGISGQMTITGGTASGDDLLLTSTSNGTKGTVAFGSLTDGLVFDEGNMRLSIGGDETTTTVNGVSKASTLSTHITGGSQDYNWMSHVHSNSIGPVIAGARSRGSEASPSVVADDDNLLDLFGLGFDGTDYEQAASIMFDVDGTPGDDDMPGRIVFSTTADGGTSPTERMRIDSAGVITGQAGAMSLAVISGSTFSTLQHLQDIFHSAGWVSGGAITDDADGTISVASGTGLIRATDSAVAEILFTDWSAEAGANVALADNDISWIYVEYNGGSPQVVATVTERTDFNRNILLAVIQRTGTTLHINNPQKHVVGDHANSMIRRLKETAKFGRVTGAIVSATGTRNWAMTTGDFWEGLGEFTLATFDSDSGGAGDTFSYWYRKVSDSGWNEVATQSAIHQTNYDDNSGTLAPLSNNKYGVHWLYIETDDHAHVVYGQGDYTLAEAEDAQQPASVPEPIEANGILVGKIIIKKSDAAFTQIESAFQTTFTGSVATDHGSLVGLSDDDHTQYLLADGSRALAGAWDLNNENLTNVDIDSGAIDGATIGASSATTGLFTTVGTTGDLTIGATSADDVQPALKIIGDADSDAGGDTDDTLQLKLTPNATPTLATWDFTSTQSAGYDFDKPITTTTLITSGAIELGAATDTTLSRLAAAEIGVEGIRVKTTTPKLVSAASYTTDTGTSLNMDNLDQFIITAQAGALLFNAPGGTLVQGRSLIIRIEDSGTNRALTWNAIFRAMGTALPSTTVATKTLYLGFFYNTTDTKWDLVASAQEA